MIKRLLIMVTLLSLVLTSACSHRKVLVNRIDDSNMTCAQIKLEMGEMETLLKDIDGKTGLSGRNVGMALIFWSGVFVNELSAGDATKLAHDRMRVLSNLYGQKNCGVESTAKQDIAPSAEPKE